MSNQSVQRFEYPPVGKLVDVDGVNIHVAQSGQGSPPVVMEAAIWDFSLTWSLVRPEVARFTQAVTYDRAGLGWSDPSPGPRTARVMVKELRGLLAAIGLPGPSVLVGQSFSGLLVRLYAYQHPEEVAGLVLVDPAHEDQFERFPEAIRKAQKPMYEMQIQQMRQLREQVAVQGSDSAPVLVSIPAGFPGKTADMYRRLATRDATRFDTMIAELEGLEESQAQVRAARKESLGDIPLVVISHGIPQDIPGMPAEVNREYEQAWQQMQVELAGISSQGKRIVAEGSGHMIHHEKPELVCAAIREVVDAVRAKGMR